MDGRGTVHRSVGGTETTSKMKDKWQRNDRRYWRQRTPVKLQAPMFEILNCGASRIFNVLLHNSGLKFCYCRPVFIKISAKSASTWASPTRAGSQSPCDADVKVRSRKRWAIAS